MLLLDAWVPSRAAVAHNDSPRVGRIELDIRKELSQDHEDHELLLLYLAQAVEAQRPPTELHRCWAAFEENLFEHLETEERALFSVAAQAHRREIEQLQCEHRHIRYAVHALGASIELQTLRKEAIDELRSLLKAHTSREERSLHHWLEVDQGIMARRGVLAIRARRERASARMRVAPKAAE